MSKYTMTNVFCNGMVVGPLPLTDSDIKRGDYLWPSMAELRYCAFFRDRILWKEELCRLKQHMELFAKTLQFSVAEQNHWNAIYTAATSEEAPELLREHCLAILNFWAVYLKS